jgi:hypothetical protein
MYSSNVGSPSTAHGTCISTPFGKECAHPRALLWAARRRLSKTDISTHNDLDVAYRTQLTLLTRLKDQSNSPRWHISEERTGAAWKHDATCYVRLVGEVDVLGIECCLASGPGRWEV